MTKEHTKDVVDDAIFFLRDALIVETELKASIKRLDNRNSELEKAIAIWCRENAGDIDFANDAEAITWFIHYTNALDL